MKKREIAINLAEKFVGLPYKWGGNDPMSGFDCSGLMIEILQSVGLIERDKDMTAHNLSKKFPETEVLQAGVLIFYDWNNDGHIDHVEMVVAVDDSGEIYTIGASGGNSATTSAEAAISQNAYVKIRTLDGGYIIATDPF